MKLLLSIVLPLGLALGLATTTFTPPAAHACGGYVPSPEDRVRWAFAGEFPQHADKPIHAITFVDDDTARVELRWGVREDRAIAQYAWLERGDDGQWKRSRLSFTTTIWLRKSSPSPAVAAR